MSIPMLFAACLLGDPQPASDPASIADPPIEAAASPLFDAAAFAGLKLPPEIVPGEAPPKESDESRFSYTWAEAGYAATKLDAPNETAHTYFLRGSIGFLRFFHVFAGYERESTSFDNATLDAYDVGGGVQIPILSRLDVVGEVSWLYNYIDSDHLFNKDTNTGVSLYGGARFMPLDWSGGGLELDGGYRYTDQTSLLSDKVTNAVEVGARVHFLNFLSVGATYAFIEQDREFLVDVRVSF